MSEEHLAAAILLSAESFGSYLYLVMRGKKSLSVFPVRFIKRYAILCAGSCFAAILLYFYESFRVEQPFLRSVVDATVFIWMMMIAYVDWEEHIVPNVTIMAGMIVWFILTVLEVVIGRTPVRSILLFSLTGFIVVGLILLAVALIGKSALGMGDVKAFATLGLFYGLSGSYSILLCTVIVMALTSVILLLLKRVSAKTALPMMPFTCVGLLFYLLAGVN